MKKVSFLSAAFVSCLLATSCTPVTASQSCQSVQLQVLGSGGPEISDGLASSSYLVWIEGKARIMVDAGGGSSFNFEKSSAKFNHLQALLLTHLHVDHSAALPIYIKAGYFSGRSSDLQVFGPSGNDAFPSVDIFLSALFSSGEDSAYPYLADNFEEEIRGDFLLKAESISVKKSKIWKKNLGDGLSISAVAVNHGPVPALAWRVDYGFCSVTFSGDMNGSSGNLEVLANQTDLLVMHNAIPEDAGRIAKKLHMTPTIIGKLANKAEAKKILLSHFMNRTINLKEEAIQQIRANYSGEIKLAEDLQLLALAKQTQ